MVQIFRAFAIIAVVLIHTTPSGIIQVFCRPFINFSVGTFFFLSGFLTIDKDRNWGEFFKKRIIRIAIPYVIWTVLYSICNGDGLAKLFINLFTTGASAHLYFIFVYIQFVLLTPFMLKLANSKYRILCLMISPTSILLYYGLLVTTGLNPHMRAAWHVSCFGWFVFYYLGLLLGNHIIEIKYSMKTILIVCLISIFFQMAEGYGLFKMGVTNCGTMLKLSSIITTSLVCLIIFIILKEKKIEIKNKFLRLLGDYSFGIYLCHMMVVKLGICQGIPYPLNSAIVIMLSFFFCYIGSLLCGEKHSAWLGLK